MSDRQPGRKSEEVDVVDLPAGSSAARTWALLLAGPVIWFGHFMLVYLAAEVICNADAGRRLLGVPLAAAVTIGATVAALAVVAGAVVWTGREWRRDREEGPAGIGDRALSFAALALAALFALAIVYTGLPALWLDPC